MARIDLFEFFANHKLLLAPMAGVSDEVFRMLACEQGCTLAYSEMVSAKGLSYANEKTRHLVDLYPGEKLIAVQLFGHEPDVMAQEATWLEEELGDTLAYVDVNMGCPARKIVKKGDGSALMTDPDLAGSIIKAINNAIKAPVTAKFRRGYRNDEDTCVEFAKTLEAAGASALTIHGRYAAQLYKGKASWECITRVKEAVDIPVIGNGDVFDGPCAQRMLKETGCDAVMIARGSMGNPWIFKDAQACINANPRPEKPTVLEKIATARRHAELLADRDSHSLVKMRKHAMWYVAGLPGASVARGKFNYCTTLQDFNEVFDELENHLNTREG